MPPGGTLPSPALRATLRRRMLAWWDAARRPLPWRFPQGEADPYRVWLSEVMCQQTRVEAAIPYYLRFVERWPDLAALAAADDAEVLAAWSGLGYYARCRNLLAAARTALDRHGGIPSEPAALRALPGFGPYTAGAVASIAFAVPAAAVDGNAARVLSRLFLVDGDPASPMVKKRIAALAEALVDRERPGDLNQAWMELGATVCVPRRPRCGACPVAGRCAAHAAGREAEVPRPRRRPAPRTVRLLLARVERGGRLLLARSPEDGLFPGMWGLPAVAADGEGPAPGGGDPAGVLEAGLRRSTGLRLRVGEEVAALTRVLTHRLLELRVHRAELRGGGALDPGRLRFTSGDEASRLPASTAMRRVIEASGGWRFTSRRRRGTKNVSEGSRKALTSRGRTV